MQDDDDCKFSKDPRRPPGQSKAWYHGYDWAMDPEAPDHVDYAEGFGIDFGSPEWEDYQKGSDYGLLQKEEDRGQWRD